MLASMAARPPHIVPTVKASADAATEARRRAKAPYLPALVVLSGPDVGQRVPLDRTVLLGRDPDAGLVLSDAEVSYRHALVEDRGDGFTLIDLGSTNGSAVNGSRVQEIAVHPGDRIGLGNTVIGLELQDREYSAAVERLLNTDDLSGLYVRRKFDAEVAVQLGAARQRDAALALLVMDLDGVKRINDAHGHLFGAYVIGESGRVIGTVLGARGIAARFGGDEYVAAVPGLTAAEAEPVAAEILRAIVTHHYERDGVVLHPGISIGVAAFPEDSDTAELLFEAADRAMYRAKQAGKGRVSR
jgi:two-component system, cell cycle response regulator